MVQPKIFRILEVEKTLEEQCPSVLSFYRWRKWFSVIVNDFLKVTESSTCNVGIRTEVRSKRVCFSPHCPSFLSRSYEDTCFFIHFLYGLYFKNMVLFFIIDSEIGMREAHFESIFLILGFRNSKWTFEIILHI